MITLNKKILVLIAIIIAVAFVLRFSDRDCFYVWDELVYLQHSEIISDLKADNFNEFYFRPIMLPVLIAGIYKINHSPLAANLLIALFGAASVFVAYKLGSLMYSKKAGIIAAFILAFWPIHISYSQVILTHVPAMFFALLFFYFLKLGEKEKKNLFFILSAVFLALCVLTRFTYVMLLPILFVNVILFRKEYDLKRLILMGITSVAVITPYFIWNYINYEHPFYAFIWARETISWSIPTSWDFYIKNLPNFLGFFGVIGIVGWLFRKTKEKISKNEMLLLSWMALFFVSMHFVNHKELRYILPILIPVLIMSAAGFETILNSIKNKKLLLFAMVIIFVILPFASIKITAFPFDIDCNSTAKQSAIWANENLEKDAVFYANVYYPAISYYSTQKLEVAPYFKDKFFNESDKYMNQSGYYFFFNSQYADERFPTREELAADPRFELINEFSGKDNAYIYKYTTPKE